MNKLSLRVWIILIATTISFVFFGGDSTSAKITDNGYFDPAQSDTPDADVNADDTSDDTSADFGILDYMKVLFSLALVIGLLIFVLRFLNKKNISYQQTQVLHSLGGVSVGPQKSVQIVKVGQRVLVVGVGENVELLANIDDDKEVQSLIELYEDQYNQTTSKPYLFQLLSRDKGQQDAKNEEKQFGDVLQKRLSEIKKERSDGLERWKDKENDER